MLVYFTNSSYFIYRIRQKVSIHGGLCHFCCHSTTTMQNHTNKKYKLAQDCVRHSPCYNETCVSNCFIMNVKKPVKLYLIIHHNPPPQKNKNLQTKKHPVTVYKTGLNSQMTRQKNGQVFFIW